MEALTNLFEEHSLLGILAIIVVASIIVSIVKSLFKMAMTIAVIGLVLVVFFNVNPQQLIDKGKSLTNTGTELIEGDLDPSIITKLTESEFFIKEENGEKIFEIESLGIRYSLNDFFGKLYDERQKEIGELEDMIDE